MTIAHVLILVKDNFPTCVLKVKAYIASSDYVRVIRRGILSMVPKSIRVLQRILTNSCSGRVAVSRMTQQAHPLTSPVNALFPDDLLRRQLVSQSDKDAYLTSLRSDRIPVNAPAFESSL